MSPPATPVIASLPPSRNPRRARWADKESFSGFACAALCILVAFSYLAYKLLFWNRFSVGMAPLVIGIFFFSSIQLISVGILGEYIGSIHTHVQKRPLVVERERVNFEYEPGYPVPSGETVMAK
jgi:hypothetical protein